MSFTRRPVAAIGVIVVAAVLVGFLVAVLTSCGVTTNEHGDRRPEGPPESGLVIDYPSPVAVCPELEGDGQ